jgi:hypothetical protein
MSHRSTPRRRYRSPPCDWRTNTQLYFRCNRARDHTDIIRSAIPSRITCNEQRYSLAALLVSVSRRRYWRAQLRWGRWLRVTRAVVRWAKWPTAVAKVTDDLDVLLAFYDFPAKHWIHLPHHQLGRVHLRHRAPAHPASPRHQAPGLPVSPWRPSSSSPSCSTTVVPTGKPVVV